MNPNVNLITTQLSELYHYGVTIHKEVFVEEMLREMYLVKRINGVYEEFKSTLLELLANYDLTSFDVGGISFYSQNDWIRENKYLYFGSDGSGDYLCLDTETDAIFEYIDRIEYSKIEESSFDFLQKLLIIAKFNLSGSNKINIGKNHILESISLNETALIFYSNLITEV
jgi:hypothetical protein